MELMRDVEIDLAPADLVGLEPYDGEEVKKLFDFLEFKTLLARLEEAFAPGEGAAAALADLVVAVEAPTDAAGAVAALQGLPADRPISVAAAIGAEDVPGVEPQVGGLAIAADPAGDAPTAVWWLAEAVMADGDVSAELGRLLSADGPGVYAHDAKPLIRALLGSGVDVGGLRLDTSLAAYLLDPAGNSYPLDVLLTENTEHRLPEADTPPEGQLDFGEASVTPAEATALDAAAVATLAPVLLARIDESGLRPLNDDVEVPLVSVLARMEHLGVAVDRSELERLNADMTAEAAALAEQIQTDAGEEFNVNSTKKLREILFEKLELTPQKRTKTGYSTDQATLEKLSGEHPIIDHLLRYREVEKLRSTYGQSLLDAVADDDRIHATFNQTVARTGRLSSENPNLHNIPVRTELGRSFRKAFIPGPDRTLLVADYNQIELRCIAHLADDPGLIEAFTTGADVHSITGGAGLRRRAGRGQRSSSGAGPRWSRTAWPTAWRPTGSVSGSPSRPRRPRSSSIPTSTASRR